MNNRDIPAYPISEEATDRIDSDIKIYTGLTKLERFTMAAMQWLCAQGYSDHKDLAFDSVAFAKATLAELEKAND